jgi:hypothetical protein
MRVLTREGDTSMVETHAAERLVRPRSPQRNTADAHTDIRHRSKKGCKEYGVFNDILWLKFNLQLARRVSGSKTGAISTWLSKLGLWQRQHTGCCML